MLYNFIIGGVFLFGFLSGLLLPEIAKDRRALKNTLSKAGSVGYEQTPFERAEESLRKNKRAAAITGALMVLFAIMSMFVGS